MVDGVWLDALVSWLVIVWYVVWFMLLFWCLEWIMLSVGFSGYVGFGYWWSIIAEVLCDSMFWFDGFGVVGLIVCRLDNAVG